MQVSLRARLWLKQNHAFSCQEIFVPFKEITKQTINERTGYQDTRKKDQMIIEWKIELIAKENLVKTTNAAINGASATHVNERKVISDHRRSIEVSDECSESSDAQGMINIEDYDATHNKKQEQTFTILSHDLCYTCAVDEDFFHAKLNLVNLLVVVSWYASYNVHLLWSMLLVVMRLLSCEIDNVSLVHIYLTLTRNMIITMLHA